MALGNNRLQVTINVASLGSSDFNATQIAANFSGKLDQIYIACPVLCRFDFKEVVNGVATSVVSFYSSVERPTIEFVPVHPLVLNALRGDVVLWRVTATNLVASIVDTRVSFFWQETPPGITYPIRS